MKELYGKDAFYCPHCNVFAHQDWYHVKFGDRVVNNYGFSKIENYYEVADGVRNYEAKDPNAREDNILAFCVCHSCTNYSLWAAHKLVHPHKSIVKPPSEYMPIDVKEIYQEASAVLSISPRASSALLRLALERLLPQVGAKKDNINNMIAQLVSERKIVKRTKEAMDSLRIIGNDAVHASAVIFYNNGDEERVALTLFRLLNRIVNETIESEMELDEIYNGLPKGKLDGIEKRDKQQKRA